MQIFLSNNSIKLLYYVKYLLEKYLDITATGPYLVTKAGSVSIKRDGEKLMTNHHNYQIVIFIEQFVQRFLGEASFSILEMQLGLSYRKTSSILIFIY